MKTYPIQTIIEMNIYPLAFKSVRFPAKLFILTFLLISLQSCTKTPEPSYEELNNYLNDLVLKQSDGKIQIKSIDIFDKSIDNKEMTVDFKMVIQFQEDCWKMESSQFNWYFSNYNFLDHNPNRDKGFQGWDQFLIDAMTPPSRTPVKTTKYTKFNKHDSYEINGKIVLTKSKNKWNPISQKIGSDNVTKIDYQNEKENVKNNLKINEVLTSEDVQLQKIKTINIKISPNEWTRIEIPKGSNFEFRGYGGQYAINTNKLVKPITFPSQSFIDLDQNTEWIEVISLESEEIPFEITFRTNVE